MKEPLTSLLIASEDPLTLISSWTTFLGGRKSEESPLFSSSSEISVYWWLGSSNSEAPPAILDANGIPGWCGWWWWGVESNEEDRPLLVPPRVLLLRNLSTSPLLVRVLVLVRVPVLLITELVMLLVCHQEEPLLESHSGPHSPPSPAFEEDRRRFLLYFSVFGQ